MGPRTLVRGNKGFAVGASPPMALQWGRALSCAEMHGEFAKARRRRNGFNGAAHSRARKFVLLARQAIAVLQRFNGAAHSRARKLAPANVLDVAKSKLQWGRALSC